MRHKFHTLRHSGKEVPDGTSASRISMIQRDSGQARMTNSENNSRGEGGQTLIEVLLALGVAVVIITAITGAVIVALNNASFSKNQNLANAYAQEGMEVVRAKRDQSWGDFIGIPGGPNYCLSQNSTVLVSAPGGPPPTCAPNINIGGIFIRQLRLQNNAPDCAAGAGNTKVTAWVYWSDGKCPTGSFCHKVELISCFSQKSSNVVAP